MWMQTCYSEICSTVSGGSDYASRNLLFINELMKNIVKGHQIGAIVMNFLKASDVVPHGSLLVKLRRYGVRGNMLQWINSFLGGRSQRVIVDVELSSVPQWRWGWPSLFLVYINNLPKFITSILRLFADDTILYRRVELAEDQQSLQQDLNALEKCESTWALSFNQSKYCVMHITKKKSPLLNSLSPLFLAENSNTVWVL